MSSIPVAIRWSHQLNIFENISLGNYRFNLLYVTPHEYFGEQQLLYRNYRFDLSYVTTTEC